MKPMTGTRAPRIRSCFSCNVFAQVAWRALSSAEGVAELHWGLFHQAGGRIEKYGILE
jgi:hypothetical protein